MDTLLTLLAVALILLPGWALWLRLAGPQPSPEVAITGLSFALALALLALHLCAYFSLTLFVALWLPAAALAAWRLRANPPRLRFDRTFVLIALAAAAIRFLPALGREYPLGWDPYFHLLVVRLMEEKWAHVFRLNPFEDIPLNYPSGSHLLVALITKCAGASRYTVFQTLLALFASLSCLQVYAWVQAATNNRRWALYAMAAYAFLAVWGSIDYLGWGGLPNLLGMYMLAGCFALIAQREAGERRWWALPPMYLAIGVCSHHVLMCAFGAMAALLLCLVLDPKRRADAKRLALSGALAALVGVPYLVHHFAGWDMHSSGLLVYGELEHRIVAAYGAVFFLAVVFGAGLYARNPRARPLHVELLAPAAAMLLLYVLLEYGGRELMMALYQRPVTPFTPNRFLTDAVYPLSAFAGLAFLMLEERLGQWVLVGVALLFLTNAQQYALYFKKEIDDDRAAAYRWVEANTRRDTLVIDRSYHTPVLTNRPSINTALPSSELSGNAKNGPMLLRIARHEVPAELAGAPVIVITDRSTPYAPPPGILLMRYPQGEIIDLNPRISARLPSRQ
jgi:hypothetical protein